MGGAVEEVGNLVAVGGFVDVGEIEVPAAGKRDEASIGCGVGDVTSGTEGAEPIVLAVKHQQRTLKLACMTGTVEVAKARHKSVQ